MQSIEFIQSQTRFSYKAISQTVELLSQDATIPFIARYRKDMTGNLDEVDIEVISTLFQTFKNLQKRKLAVIKAVEAQNSLTPELKNKVEESVSIAELEDLYLPFKKKRKTKADEAREAGLEPLARIIFEQEERNPALGVSEYLRGDIENREQALNGAQSIIAEWINENQLLRAKLRRVYSHKAVIVTKGIKAEKNKPSAQKYQQYLEWEEALNNIPSHRFLAIFRAESEGIIRVKIEVDKEMALQFISEQIIKPGNNPYSKYLRESIEDSYKRLLKPSFQTEFLAKSKEKADDEAILVFAENLEQLLLSPPLGRKRILAIDPGFKSGCKVVCLDENGALLHHENIYPHPPQKEVLDSENKIKSMVKAHKIEAIAIGNGTASRETESFVKNLFSGQEVAVYIVNEAGASVYSASKIARDEFPDKDITVRGAVSIGRRLIDPLAELVKIDAKSIGVGQYQHEVDQGKLKEKLDIVVMSCVNRIGVNVNTASRELLSYVSGIGPSLAENIIEYRKIKGSLASRRELLKIPRLGAKAFEQSAGFLRIKNGEEALDDSAVHPESYHVIEKIAKDKNLKIEEIIGNKEVLKELQIDKYVNEKNGVHSLNDILKELLKPGADPRKAISCFSFDPTVKHIEDLRLGMELPGIVNNITNFGCFVDIGIKESGLIHISNLSKGFVSDPNAIVKLNEQIKVTVMAIDIERKRIQLSLII